MITLEQGLGIFVCCLLIYILWYLWLEYKIGINVQQLSCGCRALSPRREPDRIAWYLRTERIRSFQSVYICNQCGAVLKGLRR